jgi:predicted thioesterase
MLHTVTADDTAIALGSGDVPVLATPRLIAWMESATVDAVAAFIGAGDTTVGTAVRIKHLRATPVGGTVECIAIPREIGEGRAYAFAVRATDESGETLAEGEIERAVVDRERFLARLTQR